LAKFAMGNITRGANGKKKCIIFSSYEGGPLFHLPEDGSVREVVHRRLSRNWLLILEIEMGTAYSVTRKSQPFLLFK
jgi:hypothetical protein